MLLHVRATLLRLEVHNRVHIFLLPEDHRHEVDNKMHGRLKEKTTAEQAEAKRLERQKKLKIYNAATARVIEKRKNKEYDKEGLQIAGQILSANPDVYTLWNFRREIFEAFRTQKTEDEMNKLFEEELYFVETCLRANPKSYGSWNQRCYVMTNMPRPDWMRELALCNKFLEYDERNFHCWDYRRFVVQKAAVSPAEELEFSTNKISSNFSNYSSWHYRSKLLPLVKPDDSQHIGITEEALLNEFEIVQNAFFTDPDDQSAWFYHRWLLGRGQRNVEVESLILDRERGVVKVGLTTSILVGKDFGIEVHMNGCQLEGKWSTPFNVHRHSAVWLLSAGDLVQAKEATVEVRLVACGSGECVSQARVSLSSTEDRAAKLNATQTPTLFRLEISAAATTFLTQELEQCQELHDLEPENKWALLTIVLLMRSLNPEKYRDEICNGLDKLQSLDQKRREYYRDLKSRFLFEMALESSDKGIDHLNLSEKGISSVYHHNLLLTVRNLDLSRNSIWSLKNFACLQGLQILDLHGNQITELTGLGSLPSLTMLNLQHNNISTVEAFGALATCPKLKRLELSGNPCTAIEDFKTKLQTSLPNVDIHI